MVTEVDIIQECRRPGWMDGAIDVSQTEKNKTRQLDVDGMVPDLGTLIKDTLRFT